MDKIRGLLIIIVLIGYLYMRGDSDLQLVSDGFAALAVAAVVRHYYRAWKQRK